MDLNSDHVCVKFGSLQTVVSSAVWNGGIVEARGVLNLKVPKSSETLEDSGTTLSNYCSARKWDGPFVGMMTAASMKSLRTAETREEGLDVFVAATAGLSNPRRAGDRADFRGIETDAPPPGTINIVAVTSAKLEQAALVEAVMIASEAKAAVMHDLGVKSSVSGFTSTGTGTDAIAVACGEGPVRIRYCGKHTLFGEILGRAVAEAVRASVEWDLEYNSYRDESSV